MRGATMSLTAAASGFVVFLLSVSVIQGEDDYKVTYTSTQICAVKGSTVEIRCSYTYPSTLNGMDNKVVKTFWFTDINNVGVAKRTDLERTHSGRVHDHCDEHYCTLTITDLRESDSAVYYFRFITDQNKFFGNPGVTLSVTDLQVQVSKSYQHSQLQCHSSCLPGQTSYIWNRNGQKIKEGTSFHPDFTYASSNNYSCAVKGYADFPSPSVYAPKLPSVSVSPSGEIVEGSSVTLTCSSDANPAATYFWYKEEQSLKYLMDRYGPQLVLGSIQSSQSGEYSCAASNKLGRWTSENIFINVKYAPQLPSVSVSPSGEIVEGSSVTLSCSSDANPAAKYTWYKKNQTLLQGAEGSYHFTSISSEDRGIYYCKSENKYGRIISSPLSVDVQYAPKLPSVSVSPSAEIVEGSSMTLSCSSDANPAAKYTWYKENEDSPKASGQIFSITDFRAEHSGIYYCVAQNRRGRRNNTLHLTVVADLHFSGGVAAAAVVVPVVLLVVISLCVFLWRREKKTSGEERPNNGEQCVPDQGQPEEQGELQYASVHFSNIQADPLYSNMRPAQPLRHTEQQEVVEYAAVKFSSAITAPRARGQETGEDPAALYSTVNKT